MSRTAVAAVLVGLAAAPAAFSARPLTPIPLPSPAQALTRSPPLQTAAPLFELRLPGRMTSRERVEVGLGPTGSPVSIEATQILTLIGAGDYSLAVQAPVSDVVAAPGSESQPGLRRGVILWQGFSPGRRVLGARATLQVGPSAPSLPLRVSVDARVNGAELAAGKRLSGRLELVVKVRNATTATAPTFTGDAHTGDLARVLDGLRRTVEHRGPYQQGLVRMRSAGGPLPPRTARVDAPLLVEGTVRFPPGSVSGLTVENGRSVRGGASFSARLGDGDPLSLSVRVRGRAHRLGVPTVSVRAVPSLDLSTLRPPRGKTWREAVARGLVRTNGRALLRTTIDTILRLARVRQYDMFLSNPDGYARAGADRIVYLYRSAPPIAAAPAPAASGSGAGVLLSILLGVGGVLAAGGLLVVWAHS